MSKKTVALSFQKMNDLALAVRAQYAQLEKKKYGRPWTREETMQGFVVDVGDLTREIMGQAGIRERRSREKLSHELCDCLWSIIVLADTYKIDLEREFPKNMKILSKRINKEIK